MNAKRRRARKKFGIRPTGNEHNVLTHYPKDPDCPVCQRSKATKVALPAKPDETKPDKAIEPKKFGDSVTCDHQILEKINDGRKPTVALVVQDIATYWLQAYSANTKCAKEIQTVMPRFFGPGFKPL